jgi:hypothetical protein
MVPDEGIEPPTFGLQNRCSTAELIRHLDEGGVCLRDVRLPDKTDRPPELFVYRGKMALDNHSQETLF